MKTKCITLALSFAALVAPIVQAKEYNQPKFLQSPQQSKINRVMADITVLEGMEEQMGQDVTRCEDLDSRGRSRDAGSPSTAPVSSQNGRLNIGSQAPQRSAGDPAPREQTIVAKEIINVGGYCRVRQ
jgi:hypothetical protein